MEQNNDTTGGGTDSTEDLLSKLDQATEKKEVNTANTVVYDFTGEDITTKETPKEESANFVSDPKPETKPGTETKKDPASEPKLSKELKLATARITVSALDSTQRVIFTPLINRKYAKKFTPDEVNKLNDKNIIDEAKERLEADDLTLRNKFDRLMKKRDKKLKDITFTDPESQDLEKIFVQYMDVKNEALPPEIMLFIGIANVLGKRAIDLFTE